MENLCITIIIYHTSLSLLFLIKAHKAIERFVSIKNKDTLTRKMLQEETSSRVLLFTESRYKTSEKPLLLALVIAFKAYREDNIIKLCHFPPENWVKTELSSKDYSLTGA